MRQTQADLFAQDDTERNKLSESQRFTVRSRLETKLAQLEAAESLFWRDPLDAVHEENRFQRGVEVLGEEGTALWARFDVEMERLYATQFAPDKRATGLTH